MFAKLVLPSALNAVACLRDIARLCTSSSPSVSLLSAFSQSSSVVYDAAPAGWTYVGGNYAADQPNIYSGALSGFTTTTDVIWQIAMSAPCLGTTALKYACFSQGSGLAQASSGTTAIYGSLTGATNATSVGVMTNEGPRHWSASTSVGSTPVQNSSMAFTANSTFWVIANQRHITIIQEGRGFFALWEHEATNMHLFSNTVPMVQYCHARTDLNSRVNIIVPTVTAATTTSITILNAAFNVYRASDSNIAGTFDFTSGMTRNLGNLIQDANDYRLTTTSQAGFPVYQVSPVWFQIGSRGHSPAFVTGVVPVYWTAPGIGASLDEIIINGESYRFFNCGTGVGMALKTT